MKKNKEYLSQIESHTEPNSNILLQQLTAHYEEKNQNIAKLGKRLREEMKIAKENSKNKRLKTEAPLKRRFHFKRDQPRSRALLNIQFESEYQLFQRLVAMAKKDGAAQERQSSKFSKFKKNRQKENLDQYKGVKNLLSKVFEMGC